MCGCEALQQALSFVVAMLTLSLQKKKNILKHRSFFQKDYLLYC